MLPLQWHGLVLEESNSLQLLQTIHRMKNDNINICNGYDVMVM